MKACAVGLCGLLASAGFAAAQGLAGAGDRQGFYIGVESRFSEVETDLVTAMEYDETDPPVDVTQQYEQMIDASFLREHAMIVRFGYVAPLKSDVKLDASLGAGWVTCEVASEMRYSEDVGGSTVTTDADALDGTLDHPFLLDVGAVVSGRSIGGVVYSGALRYRWYHKFSAEVREEYDPPLAGVSAYKESMDITVTRLSLEGTVGSEWKGAAYFVGVGLESLDVHLEHDASTWDALGALEQDLIKSDWERMGALGIFVGMSGGAENSNGFVRLGLSGEKLGSVWAGCSVTF